jgi:hypothetical protein
LLDPGQFERRLPIETAQSGERITSGVPASG